MTPTRPCAIKTRLESQRYSVRVADDGDDALRIARAQEFDMFVIDIGLPSVDGITLAERLLHLPASRSKPVLFVTGCLNPALRLRARSLGAFGWIEKPYDPANLLEAVQLALGDAPRDPRSRNPYTPLVSLLPKAGVRRKILLIEDDKPIAASIKVRLEDAGYEAILAYDGTQGMRFAREFRPDLILSDIRMPGGLGFTLLEQLETCGLGKVPVIYITASKLPGLRKAAFEMGARDFFEKPFEAGVLMNSIRKSLPHLN